MFRPGSGKCAREGSRSRHSNLTIVDGRIVTGQNQNAGAKTAQKMMGVLAHRVAEE